MEENNIKILDGQSNENLEAFYSRFKEQLDESHTLPGKYMFKFIIPTESKKVAQIHKIFEHASPAFSMKESKNGKYTSVSVTIYATDSTSIIEYYKEVSAIEGIMML